jgi:hypothetical protein
MSKMIRVNTWGSFGSYPRLGHIRVRLDDTHSASESVAASIARRVGLHVVTLRGDGTVLDHGRPTAHHYVTTLGFPCKGGGWTPMAEVWFSIPVDAAG